jgi:hypothetical protein
MNEKDALPLLRLRPSLFKWSSVFIICAAVSATGIAMVNSGEPKGWYVFGFFLLGPIIAPLHYFNSYLELDHKGYRMKMMWRHSSTSWAEVKDFDVVTLGLNTMVSFRFVNGSGIERVLPDNFGMKAIKLSEIMDRYQKASESHH